jgi:hypothetical protein
MTKLCSAVTGPLTDAASFRLNPGAIEITRSSGHEPDPSSTSPGTTPRAEMGVSFQRAGGVTSAEECCNKSSDSAINAAPHCATKIEEESAGDLTGFAAGSCLVASPVGLPVFRNHVIADIATENPDRGRSRERRKVAQMRHLCIAFIAAAARNGFVRGGHGHGQLCHESEAATCRR